MIDMAYNIRCTIRYGNSLVDFDLAFYLQKQDISIELFH